MKKIVSLLTAFVLCLALMLPMSVSAASASATLTGPGTIRAGDTITLSFNLNGSGIFGASGTLSYDSNQVTLSGTSQKIGSPWMVEFNGNNFVAYDNNLTNPINSNTALFTVTFKVKSVAAGTNIKISYTGVTASDGNADANVGTVTYSKTVAEPLSTNNSLATLTVSNATISPAFSADTTAYTATVPFEVSKLDIAATAADGKAKVSISNPNLTPNGTTKVSVTVTAENGGQKTYTISVKREQDPNYKASSDNTLKSITVDGFVLSPAFSADVTKYVVWLPYETTSIKVSGAAADSKAGGVEVIGGDNLLAGQDNEIKVVCTAEDGSKKTYTIIAKRAPAHDGTVDESSPEDTSIPETTSTPEDTSIPEDTIPTDTEQSNAANGIAWWWLIVVGVGALAVGGVGGFLINGVLKKKKG